MSSLAFPCRLVAAFRSRGSFLAFALDRIVLLVTARAPGVIAAACGAFTWVDVFSLALSVLGEAGGSSGVGAYDAPSEDDAASQDDTRRRRRLADLCAHDGLP